MTSRVLPILVLVTACGGGGGSSKPVAPVADPVVPAGPVASTSCYVGGGEITLTANGQVVDKFEAVARRALDPAAGTIEEEVAMSGSQPGRYTVQITVDGSTMTLKEQSGAFTGTGEMQGEPWKWTSWTTTSNLPGGMTVISTDTVEGDAIVVNKTVTRDGQTMVTIAEKLTALPCDQFEARASALVPAPAPAPAP
jgi:hypothetical protein